MFKDLPPEYDPANARTLRLKYASVLLDDDHPGGAYASKLQAILA